MRILLAVDDSEHSAQAVRAVAERPWPSDTVVRVMHAIDTLTPAVVGAISYAADDMEAVRQENKKAGEELVARVASSMVKAKPKVETVLREGTPEIEIVEEAKQWGADLIVIGSHGHTGFKRLVLGSVAHSVVAHAPCSVEVVRRKEW